MDILSHQSNRLLSIFALLLCLSMMPAYADTSTKSVLNQDAENRYGPVRTGDSLSNIAYTMFPDGSFELEQIMWAIYQANPDAFIKGNINHLKLGAVLNIPGRQHIATIEPDGARKNVHRRISDPATIERLKKQLKRTQADFQEQLDKQQRLKSQLLELEQQVKKLLEQNEEMDEEFKALQEQSTK